MLIVRKQSGEKQLDTSLREKLLWVEDQKQNPSIESMWFYSFSNDSSLIVYLKQI